MNIYTIYKFTNIINSKSYIGKTINFEKRIQEHFKDSQKQSELIFHKAIRKYGFENFSVEILLQSNSNLISEKEFTNYYEPLLIKEHKSHKTLHGYNMTWGGEGVDSELCSIIMKERSKSGTHNLQTRPDGTNVTKDRIKNGTYHLMTKPDGSNFNKERVNNGTHPWLKREDGTSQGSEISKIRSKNGTHHFLKNSNGESISSIKVKNGTHHLLGNVSCYDKEGNFHSITKKEFEEQKIGPENDWKFAFNTSYEGRKRAGLPPTNKSKNMVTCVNIQGQTTNISTEKYHQQKIGPIESWEWVTIPSKEGRKRLENKFNT